ncbi:FGGY family carbohydrate kinase [Chryseolinea sp. H1M3-3]|uniref:FGGY-family carbohydrate kinase n=1 Tax=Chryseolinea sp. H1M3-3 TaxID=3034144 RepID=UPI0023ECE052|nr:FGGY family carbohydrate kinase [Chryseolinea sp. H1M3-3]
MNRQAATLIFDIGKTTKKVLLFDIDFHVLEEETTTFSEINDDDNFPSEDLPALSQWVIERLNHFLRHPKYLITHINFSAYGASLVHISKTGDPIKFFYNYLKPFPEDCKRDFLAKYNTEDDLSINTASPFLGLLNSGLQLYWLKCKKPALFSTIETSLHFPQYFTYLLTKKKFSEVTSIGCHTLLWDFKKQGYHHWVKAEHLQELFPVIHHADHTTDYVQNGMHIKVGVGVHDSSAALMPYLVVMKEKFLLLSTGTWNICFNPFNDQLLTHRELTQDCLCYLTFEGKPVKASRIFLGHEHELQQKALAAHYNLDKDYYKNIAFNPECYSRLRNANSFVDFQPLGMEGTGPELHSSNLSIDYSRFKDFEEAQHQLVSQLVRWQKISIDLIDPNGQIQNVIVVGGFTKSKLFLEIMKRELPERKILISDHPRATALGAAWLVTGKNAYAGKTAQVNVNAV